MMGSTIVLIVSVFLAKTDNVHEMEEISDAHMKTWDYFNFIITVVMNLKL